MAFLKVKILAKLHKLGHFNFDHRPYQYTKNVDNLCHNSKNLIYRYASKTGDISAHFLFLNLLLTPQLLGDLELSSFVGRALKSLFYVTGEAPPPVTPH